MNAPTERCALYLPGLYRGVPIEDYHAGLGISKSGLDDMDRSPAYYYATHLDPNRPAPKARSGQLEGTLAHCAILEPEEFGKRYVVIPEDAPRRPTSIQVNAKNPSQETIKAVAWWGDFLEANAQKTIIGAQEYDTAWRQAEAVRKLPDVAEALATGWAEESAYWIDPQTGELCRCRPDWVHPCGTSGRILLDVKTYSDASPAEFARQVARKKYHRQDAFYSDGYGIASGCNVLAFIFVAVETEYPFGASATMLDDAAKAQGVIDYRRPLDLYAACKKSGNWPGYSTGIETISLPAWALTKD